MISLLFDFLTKFIELFLSLIEASILFFVLSLLGVIYLFWCIVPFIKYIKFISEFLFLLFTEDLLFWGEAAEVVGLLDNLSCSSFSTFLSHIFNLFYFLLILNAQFI